MTKLSLFQKVETTVLLGYAPKRHKKCVDLMTMKKDNNYNYGAQRKLSILDTRDNGLRLRTIAADQCSRKGRSSIKDTLSKRLFIDYQHSKQLRCSLTSSDLGGCYDRIIYSTADLALRRIGVSQSRIEGEGSAYFLSFKDKSNDDVVTLRSVV